MRITPIQGGVVVKPISEESKSGTGLFNPVDANSNRMKTGIIISLDENIKDDRLKEGKKVVYLPNAGSEVPVNEEVLLFLAYNEVKGVRHDR